MSHLNWINHQYKENSLFESDLHLLIITDQKEQVKELIEILKEIKIISDYNIVDSQDRNLSGKLNQHQLVIYDHHLNQDKGFEHLPNNLPWFLNLTFPIAKILITDQRKEEVSSFDLQSTLNGYLSREKITLLPEIIYQSLVNFSLQQKLTQQIILKSLIEKYKQDFSGEELIRFSLKTIQENLDNRNVYIYILDKNKTDKSNFFSNSKPQNNLLNLINIFNYYEEQLKQGKPIFINKFNNNLPEELTNILQNQKINNLLLIPLIWKNNYLGLIILEKNDISDQWLSSELNLIDVISHELSYLIHENQFKNTLKQRLEILETEREIIKNKQETKLELFSHLTHELRTPLIGILGFSKMLNQQIYGQLNPKQLEYVQGIKKSGEHLLELINDILDLSKIDAVKEELLIENIAVEEISLACIAMTQEFANQKKLQLKLEIHPEIVTCNCDQRCFKQILLNLLSNAIKFTETGTITLKITSENDYILFSVIDTGIGITIEDQTKLFQPFVQLKTPLHKQYKGTGLGLALSRKLAQLHGGDITLFSEVGKGSCFTVYLPN